MIDLNETGYLIHRTAVEKGFYDVETFDTNFGLSKIALLHSECAEVLESIRKEQGEEAIMFEVADAMIRLLDLVEILKEGGFVGKDLMLEDYVADKMRTNCEHPPQTWSACLEDYGRLFLGRR